MLVGNWMSKEPVSVTADMSMMKAGKLMIERKVRRLPVVDDKGKVVGIVTDRDLKEASPSKATTLDIHELYYLLSEIKVKDLMTTTLYTVSPGDTVENAAVIMMDKRIGGLPVVDENGILVGMITESDIYRLLIAITGVLEGGFQVALELSTEPGSLQKVLDVLGEHGARIVSLTTYTPEGQDGKRKVFIRVKNMEKAAKNTLVDDLKARYTLLFVTRDDVPTLRPL